MLSELFMGISLLGAEWVLYVLVLLSILSIALIIERYRFYKKARAGLDLFRQEIRNLTGQSQWQKALETAKNRSQNQKGLAPDLETDLVQALMEQKVQGGASSVEVFHQLAQDRLLRNRISWDRNLSILATIGSNSPFIGLFGTVLGIIQAFHSLSQQAGTGVQTVTSGLSEALVATAVGILVAIPAVVAFNLFQKSVKAALNEAEALKSFLIGKLLEK